MSTCPMCSWPDGDHWPGCPREPKRHWRLARAPRGKVSAMQADAVAESPVREQSETGSVPDPESRRVLELQGEQAETVMHILSEWVANRRRLIGLRNPAFASYDRLVEVRKMEMEVQQVERWLIRWKAIGGRGELDRP